jgi:hypothetical protein
LAVVRGEAGRTQGNRALFQECAPEF